MRILHTSDWHLGQTLHDFERGFEHRQFLDWLVDTLAERAIDVLLIAGDVFDNANPSAAAQGLWYRFLSAARQRVAHLQVVVIAGNHDSAARLEAPSPLLDALDVSVVGVTRRLRDGCVDVAALVRPLRDADGAVQAWCLALPFLRPGDVPRVEEGDAYLNGIAELYRLALEQARALCQPGQALIAMGHCHVAGGQVSEDSERRILIGGSEALPARIFDPALTYVALGHLHLAQRVGGQEHVRYSGSPLPLSFAETDYRHQVLCLELQAGALSTVESVPVPRAVELLRVPPRPAPLAEVLAALEALELPDRPQEQRPYLMVRVCLDAPEPALRSRLEAALGDKPVRLARIEVSRGRADSGQARPAVSVDELERLAPEAVFEELLNRRLDAQAPREALRAAFHELLLAGGAE